MTAPERESTGALGEVERVAAVLAEHRAVSGITPGGNPACRCGWVGGPAHWSGYSEYTVTNQWSEIVLTVPQWNTEREWPSLGDFLRAMADAND